MPIKSTNQLSCMDIPKFAAISTTVTSKSLAIWTNNYAINRWHTYAIKSFYTFEGVSFSNDFFFYLLWAFYFTFGSFFYLLLAFCFSFGRCLRLTFRFYLLNQLFQLLFILFSLSPLNILKNIKIRFYPLFC